MLPSKTPARVSILALLLGGCFACPLGAVETPATPAPAAVPSEPPLLNLPGEGDVTTKDDGPSPLLFDAAKPHPASPPAGSPTQNAVVNLIQLLVKRGAITQADAEGLVKQANEEAELAKAQANAQLDPAGSDDAVRVTYIPENVKAEIRDQLKDEVMGQARAEHWVSPDALPDWVKKMRLFGDIRIRYQSNYYPTGNDNTGAFPNFNAINTGAPFDISGTIFSPQYNVDQNRQRMVLRMRLGADVTLEDGWTAGLRIGSGQDNSPVTENQTVGLANNGQGGNFSKYALWIDRAFIRYDIGKQMDRSLSLLFGRFDNPFFTTSRMVWEDEIGFDGVAMTGRYQVHEGITPFFSAGIFPIFNTDYNFSTIQPAKFPSNDKWLSAVQIGVDLKPGRDFEARVAGAYYDFRNVAGRLSDPFIPLTAQDQGNTDGSRPSFAQNGNTYMALRNIIPDALNNFGTTSQYQYFGLASPFRVLNLNARLDYTGFEPCQISLLGDYAKNLAFNKAAINATAVNNRGPNTAAGATGAYAGGDTAWYLGLQLGKDKFEKRGDWNMVFGYRYVESDAVIDGFNDNDFGSPLAGTNLKGYTAAASIALSRDVSFRLRWMGANSIVGPPYKGDLIQLDLQAKF